MTLNNRIRRALLGLAALTLTMGYWACLSTDPEHDTDTPSGQCAPDSAMVCNCADGKPDINYTILAPDGGETLMVGDVYEVRYCSDIDDTSMVSTVQIELTPDGGESWLAIKGELVNLAPHRYLWTVPSSILAPNAAGEWVDFPLTDKDLLLKVSVYDSYGDPGEDYDVSDAPFRIRE